jgi:general transcription factor 3C polypeptide 3 (transcription factor C subunit 4)
MHASKHATIVDQCRRLSTTHQFNNEPFRILLSALAAGLRPTDAFVDVKFAKSLLREVKMSDYAVQTPEAFKWTPSGNSGRWGAVGGVGNLGKEKKKGVGTAKQDLEELEELEDEAEAEDGAGAGTAVGGSGQSGASGASSSGGAAGDGTGSNAGVKPMFPLPTKQNPMITALYGQLCIAAKSYQSGICTFSFSSLPLITLCSFAASSLSPARIRTMSRRPSDLSLLGSSVTRAVNAASSG